MNSGTAKNIRKIAKKNGLDYKALKKAYKKLNRIEKGASQ